MNGYQPRPLDDLRCGAGGRPYVDREYGSVPWHIPCLGWRYLAHAGRRTLHPKIDLLCDKLLTGAVKEVIIAISTSVEGETTLFYLMSRLKAFPDVKVTTIARGIGFGDELEYVDELTITHALLNRREV